MAKIPAPSAVAMRRQATALWSARSQASDGIVPSAAHTAANPNSDHEPGAAGYCHAVDLTHDPDHGCDTRLVSEQLRASRDRRIKYVIAHRRIFSSYAANGRAAWEWGPYSGSNPHERHMHVSLIDDRALLESTVPWRLTQPVVVPEPEVCVVLFARESWARGIVVQCDTAGKAVASARVVTLPGPKEENVRLVGIARDGAVAAYLEARRLL